MDTGHGRHLGGRPPQAPVDAAKELGVEKNDMVSLMVWAYSFFRGGTLLIGAISSSRGPNLAVRIFMAQALVMGMPYRARCMSRS